MEELHPIRIIKMVPFNRALWQAIRFRKSKVLNIRKFEKIELKEQKESSYWISPGSVEGRYLIKIKRAFSLIRWNAFF